MKRYIFVLIISVIMAACAGNMDSIKKENEELKIKLNKYIQENKRLKSSLESCQKTKEILTKEKKYSYGELSALRYDVRKFLRDQVVSIEQLSNKKVLMDYVGGEIIERNKYQDKDVTYVIYGKKFKLGDEIRIVKGFFASSSEFKIKIFRKVKDEYICIGETRLYKVGKGGSQEIVLDKKIILSPGDIIGFYFPEATNVFYDENEGYFSRINGDVKIGDSISYKDRGNLSVSLGIMGYFN